MMEKTTIGERCIPSEDDAKGGKDVVPMRRIVKVKFYIMQHNDASCKLLSHETYFSFTLRVLLKPKIDNNKEANSCRLYVWNANACNSLILEHLVEFISHWLFDKNDQNIKVEKAWDSPDFLMQLCNTLSWSWSHNDGDISWRWHVRMVCACEHGRRWDIMVYFTPVCLKHAWVRLEMT